MNREELMKEYREAGTFDDLPPTPIRVECDLKDITLLIALAELVYQMKPEDKRAKETYEAAQRLAVALVTQAEVRG